MRVASMFRFLDCRPPSPTQAKAFSRLGVLIKACSRLTGAVPSCAGRRGLASALAPTPLTPRPVRACSSHMVGMLRMFCGRTAPSLLSRLSCTGKVSGTWPDISMQTCICPMLKLKSFTSQVPEARALPLKRRSPAAVPGMGYHGMLGLMRGPLLFGAYKAPGQQRQTETVGGKILSPQALS